MDEPVAFYDYLPKRGVEELKGKIAGFGDFQVPLRQFRGATLNLAEDAL